MPSQSLSLCFLHPTPSSNQKYNSTSVRLWIDSQRERNNKMVSNLFCDCFSGIHWNSFDKWGLNTAKKKNSGICYITSAENHYTVPIYDYKFLFSPKRKNTHKTTSSQADRCYLTPWESFNCNDANLNRGRMERHCLDVKRPWRKWKGRGGGVKNKKTDVEQFSHIVPCPYVQQFLRVLINAFVQIHQSLYSYHTNYLSF